MKEQIKMLIELMESEKLEDVIKAVQATSTHIDSNLNRYNFKLLLHLSHTANKCDKQNYMTGKKITELATLLCSLLIEIPDHKTYVISIYHIVNCLISMNLYEDAVDICCYLRPYASYSPNDDISELLKKILNLWRIPINDMFHTLTTEPATLNTKSYSSLKDIIKYEMKVIQIIYINYTMPLILRISLHIDKIAIISKTKNVYFDDFCKYILEYFRKIQTCLNKDDQNQIYCHILRIICRIVCRNMNTTHIGYTTETLNELSDYFKNLLKGDEKYYQCFQQFHGLALVLFRPVEKFVNKNREDLQNFIRCSMELEIRSRHIEGLKYNAISIAEIIESLFTYWETYVKNAAEKFVDTGILLEIMNIIEYISRFFVKDILNKCKSCQQDKCTVRNNIYNAVITKCRGVNLVSKFPIKILSKEICAVARKLMKQSVTHVKEMRQCNCKCWTKLWSTCSTLIYNMGIVSEHIYEESSRYFSMLCTYIFIFEGVEMNCKYLNKYLKNPISSVLHRLCAVHYTNKMYRKAMTAAALNALLTYNQSDTKAFNMWVNIKKKCAGEKFMELTILECLRNDKDKISEMGLVIDFTKYNLIELCLREAKSLLEEKVAFNNGVSAVLKEVKKLKPTDSQYAHMIQLLGHYLLGCEHDSSVLTYQKQAISHLKKDKSNSIAVLCLEANLAFFTFVDELHEMNKQTHLEMINAKFALYAPQLPELREIKSPDVVPAYTMLNVKKDSSLILSLQKCLKKYKQLFKYDMSEIIKQWEPNLILHMLLTFGEYSRMYRYENLEAEIWTLAYNLASNINDYCTIIYVTGRSISLRHINYDWIAAAKEYAEKYKNSQDKNIIRAIAIFWISLAGFYFECGKYNDAREFLTEARNLPTISFLSHTSIYLLSLDTIICNCNLYKDDISHEDYSSYIVESLYAMVNLNQELSTKTQKSQVEYLFGYDVLFTTTINLSMSVNNLLSFREISAHLVRRVKAAQSLGAVIRTAELLKLLCYIDLTRSKLDDCEVKLQGLEHMLDLETFKSSMELKPVETSTHLMLSPVRTVDPVRDVPQQDASPVLAKKIFDLPKFTLHKNCNCYKCENVSYQYLVFTTTYIRAQLYTLQRHVVVALDHFYGAFQMREKLFEEEETVLPENQPCVETGVKRYSWQARSYITDYVHMLIDFFYFLKTNVKSKQQDALNIANLAINICHKYKLERHPVYISAKELVLDNRFQSVLESTDCSDFMVPQPHDIDISKYTEVPAKPNICVTPSVQNHQMKKSFNIRRRKNPMALNLNKINMSLNDDEDSDTSSQPITYSTKRPKAHAKLIRRKILEDLSEDDCSSTKNSEPVENDTLSQPITYSTKRPKAHAKLITRKILEDSSDDDCTSTENSELAETKSKNQQIKNKNSAYTDKKLSKDVLVEVSSLVPHMSQNLKEIIDEDSPVTTENIDKLIEDMEKLKVNSSVDLKRKKDKEAEQSISSYKNLNQALELIKNITIEENTKENATIKETLTETEGTKRLAVRSRKALETYDKEKLTKTVKTMRSNTKNISPLSTSETKTRGRGTKLNNDVSSVITRSSLRKFKEKPL